MLVEDLLADLASSDSATRHAAVAAVRPDSFGPDAVGLLLGVLCDEGSPIDWHDISRVLERLGDPVFEAVLTALHNPASDEVRRRLGGTFCTIRVSDFATTYGRTLRDEEPSIRAHSAYAFQFGREKAVPHAELLVPLLIDPDEYVRRRAVWAFAELGSPVVPLLQEVRRSGGALRRPALTALASAGGWDAVEPRDQAAVRRLIRVKLLNDHPSPETWPDTGWFALPTGDQKAVLAALDLSDAEPVTHRLGMSGVYTVPLGHRHRRCSWLYVTAEFDDWTLVFGTPPEMSGLHPERPGRWPGSLSDTEERALRAQQQQLCLRLSEQFGRAYWYYSSTGDGVVGWCLAEAGQLVRCYDSEWPEEAVGPPHPAEAGFRMPHDQFDYPDGWFDGVNDGVGLRARIQQYIRDYNVPPSCTPLAVAERTSVNPATLGPHTRVRGHGVLALTECGRENGIPRAAHRI